MEKRIADNTQKVINASIDTLIALSESLTEDNKSKLKLLLNIPNEKSSKLITVPKSLVDRLEYLLDLMEDESQISMYEEFDLCKIVRSKLSTLLTPEHLNIMHQMLKINYDETELEPNPLEIKVCDIAGLISEIVDQFNNPDICKIEVD